MHFALNRNSGEPISIDSPEAPLVFKYYGTLDEHYVRIDTSVNSLWLDPDTNKYRYGRTCTRPGKVGQVKAHRKEHKASIHEASIDNSLICTITGEPIIGNTFHITDEGHAYSQSGLNILFSCGKTVAKSPYPGSPVIKRSDLRNIAHGDAAKN